MAVTSTLIRYEGPLEVRERGVVAGFLAAYSGNTRVSYTTDLRLVAGWCADNGVRLLEVRRAHLEIFAPTAQIIHSRALSPVLSWLPGHAVVMMGALRGLPGPGQWPFQWGREGGWELLAGGDREFLVGVGEVPFDGPGGDEQILGDLAVGQAIGG
jgi:hypothetical protein